MIAKRLVISGRVHGVGFRDWAVRTAQSLGVSGTIRNRTDGTIEALVAGEAAAVEEFCHACRRGPRLAMVTSIVEEMAEPPDDPGFHRLPTL
jgi:acylphosphatase